ncbi:31436_t:CDS:2 [Gigaspora margarita]|uniref:31436_t:CDS:1 n=1 Tax=Gigaspora margarita TaxID=4874 RepID=A0ABN7UBF4_GIGMA|nr:31436_t:CDS:2 [Gigaspora margarita]
MNPFVNLFFGNKKDLQNHSQDLFKDEDYDFVMDFQTRQIDLRDSMIISLNDIEIRSLALFISFNKGVTYELCDDQLHSQLHSFGFHPIFRDFFNYSRTSKLRSATKYVQECALNCWANGWNIVVIVSSNSRFCEEVTKFIIEIRKFYDNLTLDIIIIQPKNNDSNIEDKENNDYIKRFHKNESPTALICNPSAGLNYLLSTFMINRDYRDDRDVIRFYNKKEAYYEFTNFYNVPIKIDSKEWKSSEIQAQKFEKEWLQDKIRFAKTAREAFIIARNNDKFKRKDWESPKPPNGKIFKEIEMKKIIFEKFSQHKNLLYKLLSTSNASLIEHTDNDFYWGDGGKKGGGRNRLGFILQEVREELMLKELKELFELEKNKKKERKWIAKRLGVLNKFEKIDHKCIT